MSDPSLSGSDYNARFKSFGPLLKAKSRRVDLQPLRRFADLRRGSIDLGRPSA